MRVVVVGAGMAGLTATRLLRAGGAHVDLVEGGGRAGGRVRSLTSPFLAGRVVETGAEWVDSDHHRVRALLDRFGIALTTTGQEWSVIRRHLFHGGRLLGAAELRDLDRTVDDQLARLEDAFESIGAGIADPARPDLHPEAAITTRGRSPT